MTGHAARLAAQPRDGHSRRKAHLGERVRRRVVAGLAIDDRPDRRRLVDHERGAAVAAEIVDEPLAAVTAGAFDGDAPLRVPVVERLGGAVRVRGHHPGLIERDLRGIGLHDDRRAGGRLGLSARHRHAGLAGCDAGDDAGVVDGGDGGVGADEGVAGVSAVAGRGGERDCLADDDRVGSADADCRGRCVGVVALELRAAQRSEQRDEQSERSACRRHCGAPCWIQAKRVSYSGDPAA